MPSRARDQASDADAPFAGRKCPSVGQPTTVSKELGRERAQAVHERTRGAPTVAAGRRE